jgi:hypothetical protein
MGRLPGGPGGPQARRTAWDFSQHGARVGWLGSHALTYCVLGGIQPAFDALPQLRRTPPIQVPQNLLGPVLVEAGEFGEEFVTVHPVQGHGS